MSLIGTFLSYLDTVEGLPGPVPAGDPGGYTTYYGVIQSDVTAYAAEHGKAGLRVQDISRATAAAIIVEQYWSVGRGGQPAPSTVADPALALVLADTAVNPIRGIWERVTNIMSRPDLTSAQKSDWIINARSEEYAAKARPEFQSGLQNRLITLRGVIAPFCPVVAVRRTPPPHHVVA